MQMTAIETEGQLDWNAIDWRTVDRRVRNLRQRIFKAERKGERRKVRSLQQLMLRSYSNTLQSVRRVTQQNHGKHTPGVNKVVVKTACRPPAPRRLLAPHATLAGQPSQTCVYPKAERQTATPRHRYHCRPRHASTG